MHAYAQVQPGTQRRRGRYVLAAAGVATAALAGVQATATAQRTPKAAAVPLVVYSAQGYDKLETQDFSKKYHIPVQLNDNSTGPLLTEIEASKNNPKWGLLWVDGATAFAELDDQHLLLRGFEPNVKWDPLGKAALPADRSYVPTGVTLMAIMAYNKKKVAHPPSSWQALLSSKWKGQVGMDDPSQSGPTYPFIAGMMQDLGGIAQGKAYFSKLKANGLVINPTNGPTLAALASGQINLALVQSSAGIGAYFSDHNIAVKYLNPVTILPSVIGIDAKAPAQEQREAELFARYVLSRAGQKVMKTGDPTGDSLYYPVVDGIAPRGILPPLSGVKTQSINPYTWGPKENAINSWFDSSIVK